MTSVEDRFNFAANARLEGEELEEYIVGLPPRAKILFEAYRELNVVEKVVKAAKKSSRKRKKK